MAGEITLNPAAKQPPSTIDGTAALTKGMGLSEKATQTIKDVAAILSSRSVNVTSATGANAAQETGKPTGATSIPALDNPADVKQLEENLERLIAYLQLNNEERLAQMAKDRIEVQKDTLETEREDRSKKLEKTLKDMDKAEASRKRNSIFGWLLTGLAVLAAAIACIATGGIATGAVVGAVIAVGAQILNATGAMEKIVDAIADGLEKAGMSKMAAQIVAQVMITLVILAASLGAGAMGSASQATQWSGTIAKAIQAASQAIKPAVTIGTGVMGIAATVSGGVGAYHSYEAGMNKAELTETEKYITILRQRLEESQEELELILQMLQDGISSLASLLTSSTDTSDEIARNMGAMA